MLNFENSVKYQNAFIEAFNLSSSEALTDLVYQSIPEWDSIGHLSLITNIELAFGISLEMDDITGLESYATGIEILKKYHVEI